MINNETVARPELVAQVRQAWAEVLDTTADAVPLDVNFFDAGGNSMLLVMLIDVLNETGGGQVEAVDLFQHSTVTAQANLLAAADRQDDEVDMHG
jgi:aryl carrier-like protein